MSTIKIKNDDVKLGDIQDNRDFRDKVTTSTIRNKKYKFEGEIPDTWANITDSKTNGQVFQYSNSLGTFEFYAQEGYKLDQVAKSVEAYLDNLPKETSKVVEKGTATIFGVSAKKFVYEDMPKTSSYYNTIYVFEKDGMVFTVETINYKAKRTDYNLKIQDNVLKSFKFTN
ncbi:hypothetical protein [Paenibacillus cremeus]|uniref:Uncharacterized protein n=1 Tax=Paenibacillus cremeus TaxID=2163881 RepID=A0A559K7U2_9BACL|nr:hypothetical protein [Paenibacillus cremeus]TVY08153.1 hypothetical protein FPZ49_20620 [Paenibacillus cremeus]